MKLVKYNETLYCDTVKETENYNTWFRLLSPVQIPMMIGDKADSRSDH